MPSFITPKVYFIVALIIGGILYGIQQFDRDEWLGNFITEQANQADRVVADSIVAMIKVPMVWAVTDPIGAIMVGLFWPLGFLWLLLYVLMVIFGMIAPALGMIQDTYKAG